MAPCRNAFEIQMGKRCPVVVPRIWEFSPLCSGLRASVSYATVRVTNSPSSCAARLRARRDSAVDLTAEMVRDGEGLPPLHVAIALRCTPTFVRRARAASGRDTETGGALPSSIANGSPTSFGLVLVEQGQANAPKPRSKPCRPLSASRTTPD